MTRRNNVREPKERNAPGRVQGDVISKSVNFVALFAVTFLAAGVIACSASDEVAAPDKITAALEEVPAGVVNRFILMVATGKDGKVSPESIALVQAALHEAGAEKVEPLEGSSIIFATCKPEAIYKAAQTGVLSSVEVDRLSKPQ